MLFKLLGYPRKSEIVCLQADLSLPLLFAVAVVLGEGAYGQQET